MATSKRLVSQNPFFPFCFGSKGKGVMNCDDSNVDDFWNAAMTQASQVKTTAIASQVDNLQLANMEEDECHPDDNPKSPKGYDSDEGQDTRDYEQFLQSILDGQDNSEDEGNVALLFSIHVNYFNLSTTKFNHELLFCRSTR